MVRSGTLRGGKRGGGRRRREEVGDAQGAIRRGEIRAALQGGGARHHSLLHREAGLPVQGGGARPPQPPGARRWVLPLCSRLRLPPSAPRRRRRHRPHPRRLRRASSGAGLPFRCSRHRCRWSLGRLRRPGRVAGIGLSDGRVWLLYTEFNSRGSEEVLSVLFVGKKKEN
ncbi:hypothetical protein BHE74_00033096 [Ensete ventricosum]|nr:hypothetical protein BHE74_00033096 [Ensete ventricosum]RZS27120.1 hypothetical protein BHM03_00060555 [Ensete ventricosum]